MIFASLWFACWMAGTVPGAGPDTAVDLSAVFGSTDGTFVLLDPQSHRTIRHNPARARERFLPASTFKIANSLIALETGVASGPDFALPWDSAAAPRQGSWPAEWARPQTLRSAFRHSVVWFYQELARRIGARRMQQFVDRFRYGNCDISGGIDRFWLTGALRISADEQVAFLERFTTGELGVSERTTRIVKDILLLEETPAYRLSGKTGTADVGGAGIGWLVGYVERGGASYFYALNIDGRDTVWSRKRRLEAVTQILTLLGALPGQ